MVIFFAILFTLIAVNATLLVFFSANNSSAKDPSGKASVDSEAAKIYPLDLETSKYKKAI